MGDSISLKISDEVRVRRLTLARPEKRNALNHDLCKALAAALDEANNDAGVGAVLLDAEGPVFCAGMDLDDALANDAAARTRLHEHLFTFGWVMRKPVVAAVGGPALAGGLGLVANAHVVVAAQGAQFGLTEIRIGMWPFVVYRSLVEAMGPRRSLELSLTGRIFGVNEAKEYGLVHEITPAVELDDRAFAIANQLSHWSPDTLARGLEFVRETEGMSLGDAGRVAAMMRTENFASADFTEGVQAFREKRKPAWPSLGKGAAAV